MSKLLSLAGNDKGIALIVVESILLSLDILCVGLRLWARRIRNRSLELNDYTIIVALVSCTTLFSQYSELTKSQVLMIGRCINELLGLFYYTSFSFMRPNFLSGFDWRSWTPSH